LDRPQKGLIVRIVVDATIEPGISAAGINLGTPVAEILRDNSELLEEQPTLGWSAIRGPFVTLSVRHGVVRQILVHGGYSGRIKGLVGLGSSVAQLTALLGAWSEGAYGNEIDIPVLPGVFFETEPPGPRPPEQAIIVRIGVCSE
jgi:hypothetical protein